MDIPACLAHLPRHGNLPVPYFSAIHPDGTPNFRAHDTHRHNRAIRERLCGVCGRPLGWWISFAMGPLSLPLRDSYMPAMHHECAEASLRICPWIAYEHRTVRRNVAEALQIVPHKDLPPKPKRVVIANTRSYTTFANAAGQLYARFAPPKSLEWWHYVDGQLVPEIG